MQRVSRFFLPPAECMLCLAPVDAKNGVLCMACDRSIPAYSGDQLWMTKALDSKAKHQASLSIATIWPYGWPLSAVQHGCKFGHWQLGGKMLAVLAAWHFVQHKGMDLRDFVLVPSPMHWVRRIRRGGNHARLQGEHFARVLGIPCAAGWLRRIRLRPQQVGLPRSKRLVNLKRTFAASPAVSGRQILLFDDIVTTGATMRYMAEALYAQQARLVVGASLMRVE